MDNTIAIEIDGVEIGAVISNSRKRPLLTVKIPNDERVFKIGSFDSEKDAFWFLTTLSKMYRNVKERANDNELEIFDFNGLFTTIRADGKDDAE